MKQVTPLEALFASSERECVTRQCIGCMRWFMMRRDAIRNDAYATQTCSETCREDVEQLRRVGEIGKRKD